VVSEAGLGKTAKGVATRVKNPAALVVSQVGFEGVRCIAAVDFQTWI